MTSAFHTWAEPDLYLMADADLVESAKNAVRRLCPIEKHGEPVIVPDKAWEGVREGRKADSLQDPFYGVVLFDPAERIFRCWYNAYDRNVSRANVPPLCNQGSSCCYAASPDGIAWEKPIVGRVLYENSYANNIVRFMDRAAKADPSVLAEQAWSIFPYSAPGSEDRFAASLYTAYDDPLYARGITVCFSPDGLDWRMQFPPVLPIDGDCHSMCWDPAGKCFLATTRSHQHTNLCRRWGRPWKRHVALARSRDLFHWTPMQTVLEADEGDPEDAQLYMMYIVPYGHAYLGQVLVFFTHEMVLEHQLALSRDLERWQRVGDRRPILARGEEGSWDSKHVALTNNPPHPEGDRMRYWYAGKDAPHYQAGYGALGTGTLRRDGFVCYEAGAAEGVVTTIPVRVAGSTTLTLNVDATDGEASVEMIDGQGKPIEGCTRKECAPIRGDHVRAVVNFEAGPGRYFDRGNFFRFPDQIRFRFYLRNARLYAFKAPHLEPAWPAER